MQTVQDWNLVNEETIKEKQFDTHWVKTVQNLVKEENIQDM